MVKLLLPLMVGVLIFPTWSQSSPSASINDMVWSPDGGLLALATEHGVEVYNATGEQIRLVWAVNGLQDLHVLAFSPDGRFLAGGTQRDMEQGWVYIWDRHSGDELARLAGDFAIYGMAFSPDGQRLAIGQGFWRLSQGRVTFWDTDTWQELSWFRLSAGVLVNSVAYSLDSRWFAYGQGMPGATFLMDAQHWAPVAAIYQPSSQLEFSSAGDHLYIGMDPVEVWDIHVSPEIYLSRRYSYHWSSPIIGFHHGGLISASRDGMLTYSNPENAVYRVHVEDGRVFTRAVLSPNDTRVALISVPLVPLPGESSESMRLSIWTIASGEYQILELDEN